MRTAALCACRAAGRFDSAAATACSSSNPRKRTQAWGYACMENSRRRLERRWRARPHTRRRLIPSRWGSPGLGRHSTPPTTRCGLQQSRRSLALTFCTREMSQAATSATRRPRPYIRVVHAPECSRTRVSRGDTGAAPAPAHDHSSSSLVSSSSSPSPSSSSSSSSFCCWASGGRLALATQSEDRTSLPRFWPRCPWPSL